MTQILIVHNVEYILMSLARVPEDQGYFTAAAVDYEPTPMLLPDSRFDARILDDQLSDRDSIQVLGDLQCSRVCRRRWLAPRITDGRDPESKHARGG